MRRATSEQNARSGSSSSGASRQSPVVRRRPVASGIASHGAPSVRAQAVGPSAGSASSHSRSAVCSRRSRRPACSRLGPVARTFACSSASTATVANSSPRSSGGTSCSDDAAHERQPVAERDLLGLDHEAVDRRDDERERAAVVAGVLELGERGGEALGVEREVGRVGPHRGQERLQRGVGLRAGVRARRAAAAGAQVARQVGQAHHALHRGRVGRQPGQRAGALGEEALGQRAVAVERARTGGPARSARTGSRRRPRPPRPAARRPPPRRRRGCRAARGCACGASSTAPRGPPPRRRRSCSPARVLRGDDGRLGGLRAGALGAQPLGAVGAHRLDDRDERAALVGQRVLDARRHLGERLARDDALLLQRAQAQRERARRDALRASARARRSGRGARRGRGSRAASTCRRRCRRSGRRDSRSSACNAHSTARLHLLKCAVRPRAPRCRARRSSASAPPAASSASKSSSNPCSGRPPAATSRSPRCSAGAVGRAAGLDAAHEQPVALGQADRGAQPARRARRRERRRRAAAAPAPRRAPSASTAPRSAASAGQREHQPALHAHRVEPQQPALGVDQRPAGGAARQRRRVLDRAADAAPARAAERAAGRGDQAEGRAQPAAAGVGEREHGLAGPRRPRGPPGSQRDGRRAGRCRRRSRRRRGRRPAPATRPSAYLAVGALTATSSPRSTCALVSTRPSAITTPEPRPQPRPSPTPRARPARRRPSRPPAARRGSRSSPLSFLEGSTAGRPRRPPKAGPAAGGAASPPVVSRVEEQSLATCKSHGTTARGGRLWSRHGPPPPRPRAALPAGRRARPRRRPLDAARRRRAARRREALQRAAGRARRDRAERAERAAEAARRAGAGRLAPLLRAPAALRLRADRERARAGRRAAAAGRLGRAHRRRGEPLRHAACGTALEARWWCPDCDEVVDDAADDGDVVHV